MRIATQSAFSITDRTVSVLFNAVIGGIGSVEGPIVGTVIFFALRYLGADPPLPA